MMNELTREMNRDKEAINKILDLRRESDLYDIVSAIVQNKDAIVEILEARKQD